jgi:hypothetical protein
MPVKKDAASLIVRRLPQHLLQVLYRNFGVFVRIKDVRNDRVGVHIRPLNDIPVHSPTNSLTFFRCPTIFTVPKGLPFVHALLIEDVTINDQTWITAPSQNALQGSCR